MVCASATPFTCKSFPLLPFARALTFLSPLPETTEFHSFPYIPFMFPREAVYVVLSLTLPWGGRAAQWGRMEESKWTQVTWRFGSCCTVWQNHREILSSPVVVSICSALGIWGQSSFERALSSYDADVRICRYHLFVSQTTWTSCSFRKFWCTSNINICFKISAGIAVSHSQIAYASIKEMAIYFMQTSGL